MKSFFEKTVTFVPSTVYGDRAQFVDADGEMVGFYDFCTGEAVKTDRIHLTTRCYCPQARIEELKQ